MIEYTRTFIGMEAANALAQLIQDQSIYPEGERYYARMLQINEQTSCPKDLYRLNFVCNGTKILDTWVG